MKHCINTLCNTGITYHSIACSFSRPFPSTSGCTLPITEPNWGYQAPIVTSLGTLAHQNWFLHTLHLLIEHQRRWCASGMGSSSSLNWMPHFSRIHPQLTPACLWPGASGIIPS